jgi:hypothetical protein
MTGLNGAHLLLVLICGVVIGLALLSAWASAIDARKSLSGASGDAAEAGAGKASGGKGRLDLHAHTVSHLE